MVTIINFLIVIIFIVSIFFMCCFGVKSFVKSIVETLKKLCSEEKNSDEVKLFASRCSLCKRKFVYTSNSDIKMHKISKRDSTVTLCNDCYEKLFNNNHEKKEVVVDKRLKELLGKIKSD